MRNGEHTSSYIKSSSNIKMFANCYSTTGPFKQFKRCWNRLSTMNQLKIEVHKKSLEECCANLHSLESSPKKIICLM